MHSCHDHNHENHHHHCHDLNGPVIEIKDMFFAYGDKHILQNLNLQVKHGENICVIGPNGGGKTTLLKLLLGFLRPASGTVKIFGTAAHHTCDQIGYVPQHVKLNKNFPITVKEVVLMGCHLHSIFSRHKKACHDQAQEAMEFMRIGDLGQQQFNSLSGGQRQRVLIARAIASHPALLLLDEPTANVDPSSAEDFRELINKLKGQATVLTVSHDISFITGDIDRAFVVNRSLQDLSAADIQEDKLMTYYRGGVQ